MAFSNVCDINLHEWGEIFADERVSSAPSPLLRSIKVNIAVSPQVYSASPSYPLKTSGRRLWSRLDRARPVPTGSHDDGRFPRRVFRAIVVGKKTHTSC